MSIKQQYVQFYTPLSEVQIGKRVGYSVQFSLDSTFSKITNQWNSYNEATSSIGIFYYSLDNITWVAFPEEGVIFSTAYYIRLILNPAITSYIFAEKNGTIYRIAADTSSVLETLYLGDFDFIDLEMDKKADNLYVIGESKTAYMVTTTNELEYGDNSLNLRSDPLGIAIDSERRVLWQVDRNEVCLKDLEGNEIFCLDLPDIDVDYSSSSSSSLQYSSSSSSSSSSEQYSSSSSSSTSFDAIYELSGAINPAAANGEYELAGTYGAYPYYANRNGYYIYNHNFGFGNDWHISDEVPPDYTPLWSKSGGGVVLGQYNTQGIATGNPILYNYPESSSSSSSSSSSPGA